MLVLTNSNRLGGRAVAFGASMAIVQHQPTRQALVT